MLIPCRVCGKEVGENASKCIHCGSETPSREKKTRSNILYGVLIAMAIFAAKYDDWFLKNTDQPEWFLLLGLIIPIILLATLLWLFFKILIDIFN